MMGLLLILVWLGFIADCNGVGIADHYKKIEKKLGSIGPEGIDYVYLINLDQRPERWEKSMRALVPYGICPERFSGIYGWTLPVSVLNEIGLKFQHGMWTGREYVMHFPMDGDGKYELLPLTGASYEKAYFSGWTVVGTIGCSLSHLSVLQDAYDEGYQTIWVMEDDISVKDDPHKLTGLLRELDALVGADQWDVLYTDFDYLVADPLLDVSFQVPMMWRPDMPYRNMQFLAEHQSVNENFMRIGSRNRAHSIIYRHCGLKKILDFYREHNNFLPYDQEIALIPGIQLYVVKHPIVSVHEITSDTRYRYFQ